MAIMRAIPNMTVLVPVDAVETRKMVKAMAAWPGPVYLRINRADLPVYTSEDGDYQIGKLYTMKEGKDAVVFANGVMVSKALEAAKSLEEQGISVKVVNVSTVKPLDRQAVIDCAGDSKGWSPPKSTASSADFACGPASPANRCCCSATVRAP